MIAMLIPPSANAIAMPVTTETMAARPICPGSRRRARAISRTTWEQSATPADSDVHFAPIAAARRRDPGVTCRGSVHRWARPESCRFPKRGHSALAERCSSLSLYPLSGTQSARSPPSHIPAWRPPCEPDQAVQIPHDQPRGAARRGGPPPVKEAPRREHLGKNERSAEPRREVTEGRETRGRRGSRFSRQSYW